MRWFGSSLELVCIDFTTVLGPGASVGSAHGDIGGHRGGETLMATTRRGEVTREAFVTAARELIAEQGFFATTVNQIANRAGRAAGSFYNYFDSREDLLAALFADFKAEVMDGVASVPVDPGGDPRVQLERVIRNYWLTYRKWLPELVGVFQLSMTNPEFHVRWQEIRVDAVRAIRWWVIRAQREGHAVGLEPDLAASALGAMLDNFCFVWVARGGDVPGVELDDEAAIQTLTLLWYRSLFDGAGSSDHVDVGGDER